MVFDVAAVAIPSGQGELGFLVESGEEIARP
jgi:hypothetical protein